jgi:hypothetical protein
MLVCNVSLRPRRTAIAAAIAEVAAALDASTTGNVIFGTLVDDPASVNDTIDAYLGEIMLEAASASDTATSGLAYDTLVVEATTAADTSDATIPSVPLATMDGAATNVTLSNGNLTATHSNTSTNSGVRSTATKSSGKYYFETTVSFNASNGCVGIILSTGSYFDLVTFADKCVTTSAGSGIISANDVSTSYTLGTIAAGSNIGVAIDLDARLAWFRKNGGNWNGNAGANPATGAVGVAFPITVAFTPVVGFGTESVGLDTATFNFGQSTFAYSAPSGFGNWTA